VHEGGYGCERTQDGELVFTAPDEDRLPEYSPLIPIDDDPYRWFEQELDEHDIDADTCIGNITDLTIDWHLAVAPLVPCRYG
jgi:hypothetical protein